MLSQVVADLASDSISVSLARANAEVRRKLTTSTDRAIRQIHVFDSVDGAAVDVQQHRKG